MGRKKNLGGGYKRKVLDYIVNTGLLTGRSLKLLSEECDEKENKYSSYQKTITRLVEDKYLKKFKCDHGFSGVKLNPSLSIDEIKELYPDDIYKWHQRVYSKFESDVTKTKENRKAMAIRKSETCLFMHESSISTFYNDKPSFDDIAVGKYDRKKPIYYSISEIREAQDRITPAVGRGIDKTLGTRAMGLLLTSSDIYGVYNTAENCLKWNNSNEEMFQRFTATIFNKNNSKGYKINKLNTMILMYSSDRVLYQMFPKAEANEKYININNAFGNTYMIPFNRYGMNLLEYLSDSQISESLINQCIPNRKKVEFIITDADSINDNVYELVYCLPNITRLARFIDQAQNSYDNGKDFIYRIYYFSWQEDFVIYACGELLGKNIQIVKINVE